MPANQPSPLHAACDSGDLERVKSICQAYGQNYFYKEFNREGFPLRAAIMGRHWDVVCYLLPLYDVAIFSESGKTVYGTYKTKNIRTIFPFPLLFIGYPFDSGGLNPLLVFYKVLNVFPSYDKGNKEYRHLTASKNSALIDLAENLLAGFFGEPGRRVERYEGDRFFGTRKPLSFSQIFDQILKLDRSEYFSNSQRNLKVRKKLIQDISALIDQTRLQPTPKTQRFFEVVRKVFHRLYFLAVQHVDVELLELLEKVLDESEVKEIMSSDNLDGCNLLYLLTITCERAQRDNYKNLSFSQIEAMFSRVMRSGVDINKPSGDKKLTALENAVKLRLPELARILFDRGAQTNPGLWCLPFLQKGYDGSYREPEIAIDSVSDFYQNQNPHFPSVYSSASGRDKKETLEPLGNERRRLDVLQLLKEKQIPFEGDAAEKHLALIYAVNLGLVWAVTFLLEAGAGQGLVSPKVKKEGGNKPNFTPMMLAVKENHPLSLDALLSFNGDPNAQNAEGATALTYAVALGREEMIGRLSQVTDPSLCLKDGTSSLLIAVLSQNQKIVRQVCDLLSPDMNQARNDGLTPLLALVQWPCSPGLISEQEFGGMAFSGSRDWFAPRRVLARRHAALPRIKVESVSCSKTSMMAYFIQRGADPQQFRKGVDGYNVAGLTQHLLQGHGFLGIFELVDAGVRILEGPKLLVPEEVSVALETEESLFDEEEDFSSSAPTIQRVGFVNFLLALDEQMDSSERSKCLALALSCGVDANYSQKIEARYGDPDKLEEVEYEHDEYGEYGYRSRARSSDYLSRYPSRSYVRSSGYRPRSYVRSSGYRSRQQEKDKEMPPKVETLALHVAPIHLAVYRNDFAIVKQLLEFNSNLIHQPLSEGAGILPIHLAQSLEMLDLLVASGADIYDKPRFRVKSLRTDPWRANNLEIWQGEGSYFGKIIFGSYRSKALASLLRRELDLSRLGLSSLDFLRAELHLNNPEGVAKFIPDVLMSEGTSGLLYDAIEVGAKGVEGYCFDLLVKEGFRLLPSKSPGNSEEWRYKNDMIGPNLTNLYGVGRSPVTHSSTLLICLQAIAYLCYLSGNDSDEARAKLGEYDPYEPVRRIRNDAFKVRQRIIARHERGSLDMDSYIKEQQSLFRKQAEICLKVTKKRMTFIRYCFEAILQGQLIPKSDSVCCEFVLEGLLYLTKRGFRVPGMKALKRLNDVLKSSYQDLNFMLAQAALISPSVSDAQRSDDMRLVIFYGLKGGWDGDSHTLVVSAFNYLLHGDGAGLPRSLSEVVNVENFDQFAGVVSDVSMIQSSFDKPRDKASLIDRYGLFAAGNKGGEQKAQRSEPKLQQYPGLLI